MSMLISTAMAAVVSIPIEITSTPVCATAIDVIRFDTAGSLYQCGAVNPLHGRAHVVEAHVVEHNNVCFGCERFFRLGHGFHFHFDLYGKRRLSPSPGDSGGDASCCLNVVVFYQDAVDKARIGD